MELPFKSVDFNAEFTEKHKELWKACKKLFITSVMFVPLQTKLNWQIFKGSFASFQRDFWGLASGLSVHKNLQMKVEQMNKNQFIQSLSAHLIGGVISFDFSAEFTKKTLRIKNEL